MVKISEIISNTELKKIRRQWSPEKGKFYFSVVDVIDIVTESTDARNYWKVLKNRLKNTQNKLVTECNQLKMLANDGKFYLTDTLDSENILALIKLISPSNLPSFRTYFERVEKEVQSSYPHLEYENEIELPIDGYQDEKSITILAMVAGVPSSDISINASRENLIIKGERTSPLAPLLSGEGDRRSGEVEELSWGKFSRSIPLPAEIEIESVSATLDHGLLVIKMKKFNKALTKTIEIKNI